MSGEKCSECSGTPANYLCISRGSFHVSCFKCVKRALAEEDLIFFTRKSQMPLPDSVTKCSVCQLQPAEEVCCCEYPPQKLCPLCKLAHIAPASSVPHDFVSLLQMKGLENECDFVRRKQELVQESIAEEALKSNLFEIARCEKIFQERCETLLTSCDAYAEEQTSKLSHLKKEMQNSLKVALAEAKEKIMDWGTCETSPFMELLVAYWEKQRLDMLELFRCNKRVTETDLGPVFGVKWESRIDVDGKISPSFLKQTAEGGKSFNPDNPLLFSDVESFISANSVKWPNEELKLKLKYYQAHYQVLQAMDESFHEVMTSPPSENSEIEWMHLGCTRMQEKIQGNIPDSFLKKLNRRISEAFKTQKRFNEEKVRNDELKSVQSGLIDEMKVMNVPKKRGPGRPPKIHPQPQKYMKRAETPDSDEESESSDD